MLKNIFRAESNNEFERKNHTLMSMCVSHIFENTRFSRIITKILEVHEKIKNANKTINQCGVIVLYHIQLSNVCTALSLFLYLK